MLIKDFQNRYQYNTKADILGRGGFAVVYKAHDLLLNRVVALKFFSKSGDDKHTLIQEISRVISLEHHNLCRYYDAALLESQNLHGETDETEVGVMEFLDGGDLKSYCRSHPEHRTKLLIDVLNGMSFLHKKGIIHRDLKPQNILIKLTDNGPVAKITDFGISKDVKSGDTSSSLLMGTIEYMAPEQFNPQKYGINGKISVNLDIWSFGLIVYELVTGAHLFGSRTGDSSAEQVMGNILNDELVYDKIAQLAEPYYYLVKSCLVKDAKQRLQNPVDLINKLTNGGTEIFTPENFTEAGSNKTITLDKGSGETIVAPRVTPGKIGYPAKKRLKKNAIILSTCAGITVLIVCAYLYIKKANARTGQTYKKTPPTVVQKNNDPAKANGGKPVPNPPSTNLPDELKSGLKNKTEKTNKPSKGKGNELIKPATLQGPKEYHQTGNYYDGMAAVEDNEKWGYVNEAGKEVVPLIYDDASPFSEGLAAVTKAGKVGFIDKSGREVIHFIYSDSGPFLGGLAIVKKDGKKGFIDQSGREFIPLIYDDATPYSEGLAKVKKDGKFGFIDKNGNVIIPLNYDYAMPFSKGKALVKKDGQFAYINKLGNIIPE